MKVFGRNVLVEPPTKGEGSADLIEKMKENLDMLSAIQKGVVVTVGEELKKEDLSVGDTIIYRQFNAVDLKERGVIVHFENVVAKE